MVYAAVTFWLLMAVLTSWGLYRLLTSMIRPKVLNTLLLPGTLVAQLGHVVGLLITGGTINDTTLLSDDDTGQPKASPSARPRIPIIGPLIVSLLPLAACALAIVLATQFVGQAVAGSWLRSQAAPTIPTSIAGFWQMLRDQITLVESLVTMIASADFGVWQTWLFFYLLVCLVIRVAPLEGHLRGALGAILVAGTLGTVAGLVFGGSAATSNAAWATLTLAVAALLLLLLIALCCRGTVGLWRLMHAGA